MHDAVSSTNSSSVHVSTSTHVPELAAPVVDDVAIATDSTGAAAPTPTICSTGGLNHNRYGDASVLACLNTWSVLTAITMPQENLPTPPLEPTLALELSLIGSSKCSAVETAVSANSMTSLMWYDIQDSSLSSVESDFASPDAKLDVTYRLESAVSRRVVPAKLISVASNNLFGRKDEPRPQPWPSFMCCHGGTRSWLPRIQVICVVGTLHVSNEWPTSVERKPWPPPPIMHGFVQAQQKIKEQNMSPPLPHFVSAIGANCSYHAPTYPAICANSVPCNCAPGTVGMMLHYGSVYQPWKFVGSSWVDIWRELKCTGCHTTGTCGINKHMGLTVGYDTSYGAEILEVMPHVSVHGCKLVHSFHHEKLWDPGGLCSCPWNCQWCMVLVSCNRIVGAQRGITIKSTGISLFYVMTDESLASNKGETEKDENECLINLIDNSPEVTIALRITDDAWLVVDCIEGIYVHTETVLCQTLGEKIGLVLTLKKMDRCFLELQLESEESSQTFSCGIENAHVIMVTYEDVLLGDVQVYLEKGIVAFSAILHGWACTTSEGYYILFCYEPIKQIIEVCMNDQNDKLWPMLKKLGITMKIDDLLLVSLVLLRDELQLSWDPGGHCHGYHFYKFCTNQYYYIVVFLG